MGGDDEGDVLVWGDNTLLVLGISTRATARKRPFPVVLLGKEEKKRILPKCTKVVASGVHTLALGVDGVIYSWVGLPTFIINPLTPVDFTGSTRPCLVYS